MIIALAHSFAHRSRYTHSGAQEAVKFRHKHEHCTAIPQLSETNLPPRVLFIYAAEARVKMQVLHTEPKSLPAGVIGDL